MSEMQSLAPIIEQYGAVQSFMKDPFYGPLMKTIRKRQKKALKQQENASLVLEKSTEKVPKSEKLYNTEWKAQGKRKSDFSHSPSTTKKPKQSSKTSSRASSPEPRKSSKSFQNPSSLSTIHQNPSNQNSPRYHNHPNTNSNSNNLSFTSPRHVKYNYTSNEADKTISNFPFINPAFRNFIHIDTHPDGRATTIHAYISELEKFFKEKSYNSKQKTEFMEGFQEDFGRLSVLERNFGEPFFVISVLHGGCQDLPDPLTFYAKEFSNQQVKHEAIGQAKDVTTCTLKEYFRKCRDNYNTISGTMNMGPLRAVSMVNKTGEEVSCYSDEYLDRLEDIPILKFMAPWGTHSVYPNSLPKESNDGPILWIRPGEQLINTSQSGDLAAKIKRNRSALLIGAGAEENKSSSREYIGKRRGGDREKLIEDRTLCHADHVEEPHLRQTTTAVGVLKHTDFLKRSPEQRAHLPNRAVKRVIAFDARSFYDVVDCLEMNLFGMPLTQCTKYVDKKRLNYMRSLGIKYSTFDLYENDIYIIPRHVIHQFRSLAAVTSLAWHVRLEKLHLKNGDELNKMQSNMKKLYEKRGKSLVNVFESEMGKFFSSASEEEDTEEETDEEEETSSSSKNNHNSATHFSDISLEKSASLNDLSMNMSTDAQGNLLVCPGSIGFTSPKKKEMKAELGSPVTSSPMKRIKSDPVAFKKETKEGAVKDVKVTKFKKISL